MIKIKAVFLVIMSGAIAAGCSNIRTKDDRFSEQLMTNSKTQVYQVVKKKAEQDLKQWINLGLRNPGAKGE